MIKWIKKIIKIFSIHYDNTPVVKNPMPESPVDKVLDTDPDWLKKAFEELGQKEISGEKDNPRIIEYHSATTLKASEDEVPWCSSFVSWILEKSNIKSTRSASARSYLDFGEKLFKAKRGAIAVFARPPNPKNGHVAFYLYETDKHICVLGGNQDNQVKVSLYNKSNLLAYRWPKE